jgi:hypothetical protein
MLLETSELLFDLLILFGFYEEVDGAYQKFQAHNRRVQRHRGANL